MSDRYVAGLLRKGEVYVLDRQTGKLYPYIDVEVASMAVAALKKDPSLLSALSWSRRIGEGEILVPVELADSVISYEEPPEPVFSATTILESDMGISVQIRRPEVEDKVSIVLQTGDAEQPFEIMLTYDEVALAASALLVAAGMDPSTTELPTKEDILTSEGTTLI